MASTTNPLAQSVIDELSSYIVDKGLKSGDVLPSEGELATQIGVSRTIVREALGAMAALKLIDRGNGRRARVSKIDASILSRPFEHAVNTAQVTVTQIWDARCALETRTAELAALRRTDAQAKEIMHFAQQMEQAGGNLELQTQHDIAFHGAIARAACNPVFVIMIDSFADLMRKTCPIGWMSRKPEARHAVFEQHYRIAEAIQNQDPAAARAAMGEHFKLSIQALASSGFN